MSIMKSCSCGQLADVHVVWGVYEFAGVKRDTPMNEADMCNACAKNMYEGGDERAGYFKHSVAAGHMHYELSQVGGVT